VRREFFLLGKQKFVMVLSLIDHTSLE